MLLQPFFLSRHCCLSRARQQRNCSFLFREREKKLSAAVQSARKDRKRAARAEKEAVECFLFPAQQSHFAAAASSVGPKRPAPQGKKSACLPLLPRPFLSRNRNPTAPVRKDASNGPIQEKRLSKFVHTQQSSRVPILQKKKKKNLVDAEPAAKQEQSKEEKKAKPWRLPARPCSSPSSPARRPRYVRVLALLEDKYGERKAFDRERERLRQQLSREAKPTTTTRGMRRSLSLFSFNLVHSLSTLFFSLLRDKKKKRKLSY